LSQVFSQAPVKDLKDRLPTETYDTMYRLLCQSGVSVCRYDGSRERLAEMRGLYEGYAEAMSRHLCMPLPPWVSDRPHKDNWQTVARVRAQAEEVHTDGAVASTPPPRDPSVLVGFDDRHEF
jgi:hypothetical protein